MVKMSVDPVKVKELQICASSNGEKGDSWEETDELQEDRLGLITTPKQVSPSNFCIGLFTSPFNTLFLINSWYSLK